MKIRFLFFFLLSITIAAKALEFPLPEKGIDLVGKVYTTEAQKADTLSSIGIRYDIGYYEMVEANALLPKSSKIKPGTVVIIPARFILPTIRNGLVVNLAELRAYYFPEGKSVVYTFPVGAGREGWNTPKLITTVNRKKENPVWIVPDSIMAESIKQGKPLKRIYKPGPDNPLGKYAIYLSVPSIRIHGTNLPATVGRRISHGCIRLLPNDIQFLYEHVPVGARVEITHEQHKAGWDGFTLYLESEVPFHEYHDAESINDAIADATKNHPAIIDWNIVRKVEKEQEGIPVAIGHNQ